MVELRNDYLEAYHLGGGTYSRIYIYVIINVYNGKKFIGETFNMKITEYSQLRLLERNEHPSKSLNEDYHKYGKDCFKFSMIDIVEDINQLKNKFYRYYFTLKPEYNEI